MIAILAASFVVMLPTLASPAHAASCTKSGAVNTIEGCLLNFDDQSPISGMNVYVLACNSSTEWKTTTDTSGYFSFSPHLPNGSACILTNWGFVVTVNGVISNLGTSPDDVTWGQWAGDFYTDGGGNAFQVLHDTPARVINVIVSVLSSNTRFATLNFAKTVGVTVTETIGVDASIDHGAGFKAGYEQGISRTFSSQNGFTTNPGLQGYFAEPSYEIGYYCGGTQLQSFGYYFGFSCTGRNGAFQGLVTAGVSAATGAAYTIVPLSPDSGPPSGAIPCSFNVPQGFSQQLGTTTGGSTSTSYSVSATPVSIFGFGVTLSYATSTSWDKSDATTVTIGSTDGQTLNFAFYPASGPCSNLVFGSELHVWDTSAPPDFTISTNPGTLNVAGGSTGSPTIFMTGVNGFNEQVQLTFSAPTGFSISPNPENVFVSSSGGSANPVISVGSAVTCGLSYYVYFLATSSGNPTIKHWTRVLVNVVPASPTDFCIASAPNTAVVDGLPGATSSTSNACPNVYVASQGSTTVSLTVSAQSGISTLVGSPSLSVNNGIAKTYVCYSLPSGSPLNAGTYQSTITATAGGTTHSISVPVNYVGDYQLGTTSSSIFIAPGASGSLQLTATSNLGFSGWIYSSTSSGSGISGVVGSNPMLLMSNPGWSSTTLAIYVSSSTPVGSYNFNIQGIYYAASGAPVTRSTSVTVYVTTSGGGGGGGGGGGPPRPMSPNQ